MSFFKSGDLYINGKRIGTITDVQIDSLELTEGAWECTWSCPACGGRGKISCAHDVLAAADLASSDHRALSPDCPNASRPFGGRVQ